MRSRLFNILIGLLFLVLFCSGGALANENQEQDDWQFNLMPFYFWGINVDGDLSAGPVTAPLKVTFDDVFDSLEAAFIFHFETLYKGRLGFIFDLNYLELENTIGLPNGINQRVNLEMTLAETSAYYRIKDGDHRIDFIGGLRYVDMHNAISFIQGPKVFDENQDWFDPLVGARWAWGFADGWSLVTRGDVGGFGLGSESSWHALGLVWWQPWKNTSFVAGYRALYADYEDGSGRDYFNFDATVHGPVFGVNFNW